VAVNMEQAEDWNGASGREFIEQRERHERMLGPLRARLLVAAQVRDGENVLDVGCGCGEMTVLAARAAGSGHALGADFSRIQVTEARRLAAAAGVANARFEVAEAAALLGLREKPGPPAAFSLADTGRVGALLSGAGFGGVEFAQADEPMLVGRDVADVLEYERASPTATEILAGLSPVRAAELTGQVRDRLAAYASADGVVMPGAAWLVTAQAV